MALTNDGWELINLVEEQKDGEINLVLIYYLYNFKNCVIQMDRAWRMAFASAYSQKRNKTDSFFFFFKSIPLVYSHVKHVWICELHKEVLVLKHT